ncbi:MAG: Glyoxalase/Bleomycin resistance protein/Dioxygenase superfamily [Pseudomonadota bacterium]|jgi:extradiol dioxygenase family protein
MAEIQSLNHSAICVHDLQEAEDFYCGILGARMASSTDFVTEDVVKGRSLHKSIILSDYLIALMLARDFMPMPADAQNRGAHGFRHAFYVPRARFDELLSVLRGGKVPFEGPVEHPAAGPFGASVYLKDPSGNFLEFLWRRDEGASYDVVQGVGEG